MKKMISIVIPIYNVENYLDRCIESIVHQTYDKIEIILVDDGSPDKCPDICDKWAIKDARITVIHKKNGGLSDARNCGIHKASGEYLLLVDSDDYLELNACEKLIQTAERTESDFVVGVIREINNGKISYQKRSSIKPDTSYTSSDFIIQSISSSEWYAPSVLNMYKTEFIRNNSLYFKVGILHEDMEFLPRLYLSAKRISYNDYPFYNYEIRENSIMTSNSERRKDNILDIYKSWMEQFKNVKNIEVQKYLYGALIKHYLHTCRVLKLSKWVIKGLDFKFAIHYSLSIKEKIKVVLFTIAPNLYIKL